MKLSQRKARGEATVVFGAPKTGKTELVGHLASDFRLLWLDLENGAKTLETRLSPAEQENIDYFMIPDTKTNPCAIKSLLKIFTGAPMNLCENHGLIGCPECTRTKAPQARICLNELKDTDMVVVDSGTQLSDSAYNHIANGDAEYKFEWSDWDRRNQLLAMILSQVQNASYHTTFICHEIMVELPDKTEKLVPNMGTRAFAGLVSKYFSNVIYCTHKGGFKVGSTQDFSLNVIAGNRAGLKIDTTKGIGLVDIIKSGRKPENKSANTLGTISVASNKQNPTETEKNLQQSSQESVQIQSQPESAQPIVDTGKAPEIRKVSSLQALLAAKKVQ